jgi:hypothetical protein
MIWFLVVLANESIELEFPQTESPSVLYMQVKLVNLKEGANIIDIKTGKILVTDKDHYVYVVPKGVYAYYILDEGQNRAIYEVSAAHIGFFERDEFDLDPLPSSFKEYPFRSKYTRNTMLKLGIYQGRMGGFGAGMVTASFTLEMFNLIMLGPVISYFSIDAQAQKWNIFSIGARLHYLFSYRNFYLEPQMSYLVSVGQRMKDSSLNSINTNNNYQMEWGISVYYRWFGHILGIGFNRQQLFLKDTSMNANYVSLNYMRGFEF